MAGKTILQKLIHSDNEPTPSPETAKQAIKFHPKKGLGSFHYFGEVLPDNKKHMLFRSAVIQCTPYLTLPNAEDILKIGLPEGFVSDAKSAGWTLMEAVTYVKEFYASKSSEPKAAREHVDTEAKQLAALLASVAPKLPASKLLTELQRLIEEKGAVAVTMLEEMEKMNGRDKREYIYIRKVNAKSND